MRGPDGWRRWQRRRRRRRQRWHGARPWISTCDVSCKNDDGRSLLPERLPVVQGRRRSQLRVAVRRCVSVPLSLSLSGSPPRTFGGRARFENRPDVTRRDADGGGVVVRDARKDKNAERGEKDAAPSQLTAHSYLGWNKWILRWWLFGIPFPENFEVVISRKFGPQVFMLPKEKEGNCWEV